MITNIFFALVDFLTHQERIAFPAFSLLFGILCLFLAYFLQLPLMRDTGSALRWLRSRVLGMALGLICLLWSAYHTCVMLEGHLARFHPMVWLLVPIAAILSWFYLDFLLARAAGGFFVLSANLLIYQAFVHAIPWQPLYSIICLALGVIGLFAIGAPWKVRAALQFLAKHRNWQRTSTALLSLGGVLLILLPLLK